MASLFAGHVSFGDEALDTIALIDAPGRLHHGSIEVRGLATEGWREKTHEFWLERLTVHTGKEPPESDQPAVLGTYRLEGDRLVFTPRFPFLEGQPYFVRWRGLDLSLSFETTVQLQSPKIASTTTVEAIYPSSSLLPENVLKLYIQFSDRMSRNEAIRHLHLLREDGSEVSSPFVAPQHELWNPQTDRLTVFFDPGRIKRGVGPNEVLGPALEVGETYQLRINTDWLDAQGQSLQQGFSKQFTVVEADYEQPDTSNWRISPPATIDAPLKIDFPEPLDHALLVRLLRVVDHQGHSLPGSVQIKNEEQRWIFQPAKSWSAGAYTLEVNSALEDIAGNSLRRAFESDLGNRSEQRVQALRFFVDIPEK